MAFASLANPVPRADQLLPSHLAIRFAAPPGIELKDPPIYILLPLIAMALTFAPNPVPKADQADAVTSHLAIPNAEVPFAVKNTPPTTTLLLPSISMAKATLLNPVPRADQAVPSHLAILFADAPPAVVNSPPAYTSVPFTAMAFAK